MPKMRVLMIISSFYPLVGGAEKQALLLAKVLKTLGVEIAILTRRYPGMAERDKICGVNVIRAGIHHRNKAGSTFSFAAWLLYSLIHHDNYDIFHAHQPYSSAFLAGAMAKLTGKPAIAKIPGSASIATLSQLRVWAIDNLLDAIIVTNETSKNIAISRFRRSAVYVIPNGVVLAKNIDERYSALSDVVLSVGRLESVKNTQLLVKAWPRVHAVCPNARLIIIGSGSQLDTLRLNAMELGLQDCIDFIGQVDPFQVHTYYRHAGCFVSTSISEGISNSLLEAIAAKVPVVASRVSGNTDVIVDGETGLLFEPDDSCALAEAIISILRDKTKSKYLAAQAFEYAKKNFNISIVAQRYIDLYHDLLAKRIK